MKGFMGWFVPALACCLALTGCALWGTDRETVTVCGRGFTNDLDWARASPHSRTARALWKMSPGIEFEGKTARPSKATTIWFKNAESSEFASCSRHSCDTGRCVWRVRLYSKEDGQWRIRFEYDLGRPRQ
ncbi:MAG TPA: hypothetical protein VGO61_22935 [Steroidobacteraceae bacterium]|jgi:hypothetical protein|nr:hypothetical protein [Steroidobacteraceae bacterium]